MGKTNAGISATKWRGPTLRKRIQSTPWPIPYVVALVAWGRVIIVVASS